MQVEAGRTIFVGLKELLDMGIPVAPAPNEIVIGRITTDENTAHIDVVTMEWNNDKLGDTDPVQGIQCPDESTGPAIDSDTDRVRGVHEGTGRGTVKRKRGRKISS